MMRKELKPGDRVRVDAFRTLPAFDGTIEAKVGCGFNVRSDADGKLWFRELTEMTAIAKREAAE